MSCEGDHCQKTEFKETVTVVESWSGTDYKGNPGNGKIDQNAKSYSAWVYVFRAGLEREFPDEDDCAEGCSCDTGVNKAGPWQALGGVRYATISLDNRLKDWPKLSIYGGYTLEQRVSDGDCKEKRKRQVEDTVLKTLKLRPKEMKAILAEIGRRVKDQPDGARRKLQAR